MAHGPLPSPTPDPAAPRPWGGVRARRRFHPLAVSFLLACGVAGPAFADQPKPAAAPAHESADERAARWLAKGNKAFKDGRFADAEKAYREAWNLKKGYDIAGNLGAAEMAQGKLKEAAAHLAFTRRHFPITGEPALRDRMNRAFDQCKKGVGAVHVDAEPRGAQVWVDGEAQGEAPLADDVFLDPGEHTFEARLDGYTGAAQRVRVDKGGAAAVTLTLTPIPPPAAPVAPAAAPLEPTAPAAPEPPARRSILPGLAIGAVSLVGIVGGVAFLGMSASRREEAEAARAAILASHGSCVKGAGNFDAAGCPGLAEKLRSDDTLHNVAVAAFIAGGVAAAGAAVYFLWPQRRSDTAGHELRVTPTFGAGRGAVMVSGGF